MHRESEQRAWGKSTLPFPLEVGFDEVEGEVDAYVDAVFWASSTQNKAWHVHPAMVEKYLTIFRIANHFAFLSDDGKTSGMRPL